MSVRHVAFVAACGAALLAPMDAFAVCVWAPTLTMTPASGAGSKGFDFTWAAVPTAGDCSTFSVDHYRIVLKEGSYPTGVSNGRVYEVGTGTSATALPLRSEREFYARLFACENGTCTDIFGSGAGELIDTDPADDAREIDTTDAESWSIVGLASTDGGIAASVVPLYTNDPTSFFYPSGTTHAGKLALYTSSTAGSNDKVVYSRTTSTGWDDFNRTSWAVTSSEVFGSHTSDTDYDGVSHSYVLPVDNGTDVVVRALAQNQGSGDWHIVWVDSTDDVGDDFGLYCASCCADTGATECDFPTAEAASPATAGVAVCADSSSSCDYLSDALHGRWMWDYIADPVPDMTSDAPSILFSGSPDGSTCTAVGGGQADIYQATWNPSSEEWEVVMDSGCPKAIFEDAHDPGVIPLPNGDFKVYVVDSSHDVTIHYYNAILGDWESDTSNPEIHFAGPVTVTHDCIANVDPFVYVDGDKYNGMFLYIHDSGVGFESGTCTQGSDDSGSTYSNLFFAELQN
ncbi:MAG: hypothetical protein H6739_28690 [Alphaproteobacteria bacterium]|nr:hypothetical protein [Alphaproteobacteria bacterium]